MTHRTTSCLLGIALALAAPWVLAQDKLSDSERAKRDAAKVFNFIKFHAVRGKAAPSPAVATTAAAAAPAAVAARPRAAEPEPAAKPAEASQQPAAAPASRTAMLDAQPGTTLPPAAEVAPIAAPVAAALAALPEPEPEEIELQLVNHVQPEMPRGHNLRNGSVRVRFTVMPDGSVSKVSANEGAQRRLANSATRAVEQWRFAPVPQAQEVEVDIDFRFDD